MEKNSEPEFYSLFTPNTNPCSHTYISNEDTSRSINYNTEEHTEILNTFIKQKHKKKTRRSDQLLDLPNNTQASNLEKVIKVNFWDKFFRDHSKFCRKCNKLEKPKKGLLNARCMSDEQALLYLEIENSYRINKPGLQNSAENVFNIPKKDKEFITFNKLYCEKLIKNLKWRKSFYKSIIFVFSFQDPVELCYRFGFCCCERGHNHKCEDGHVHENRNCKEKSDHLCEYCKVDCIEYWICIEKWRRLGKFLIELFFTESQIDSPLETETLRFIYGEEFDHHRKFNINTKKSVGCQTEILYKKKKIEVCGQLSENEFVVEGVDENVNFPSLDQKNVDLDKEDVVNEPGLTLENDESATGVGSYGRIREERGSIGELDPVSIHKDIVDQ